MKRHHIPLLLGFLLPLSMVLFIVLSVYVPTWFLKPQYNFLYTTENSYTSLDYKILDGKLVQEADAPIRTMPYRPPQFYIHNVTTNTSTLITFEEAQALTLDPSKTSPDGFEVSNGYQAGGFFPFSWGGSGKYDTYLTGRGLSKKLAVESRSSYYGNRIFVLGWIIK